MEQIAMWVDFTSDMLYWLAINVSGDKEFIDPFVVDAILNGNCGISVRSRSSCVRETRTKRFGKWS